MSQLTNDSVCISGVVTSTGAVFTSVSVDDASTILREAANIVEGSRNVSHGDKERSFNLIAQFWSLQLGHPVTARNVAEMMMTLKLARSMVGQPVRDHFLDAAGYAAIAGELALGETDAS